MNNNKLIFLVESSKHDNMALLAVLKYFEPKLKSCLYQTQPFNREDLRQDLLIKLINTIKEYDIHSIPGFWDMKNRLVPRKIN